MSILLKLRLFLEADLVDEQHAAAGTASAISCSTRSGVRLRKAGHRHERLSALASSPGRSRSGTRRLALFQPYLNMVVRR